MSYEAPVYYLYWILTTLRDYDHYMDRMMDDGQRADKQDDVPRTDRLNHELLRYHSHLARNLSLALYFRVESER